MSTETVTPEFVYRAIRKWAVGVGIGFAILTGGLGLALSQNANLSEDSREALVASGKAVAVSGCNRDYGSQKDFRSLLRRLDDANALSYKSGRIDLAARQEAKSFYKFAIQKVIIPDCRAAETLLTDDPLVPIPVLKPLHEGS